MRALTVSQVREVLSSAPATAFFESWAAADAERVRVQARLDEIEAHAVAIEGRVRRAEALARHATEEAEAARVRALDAAGPVQHVVRLEAQALAQSHLQRAQQFLHEAAQRRERSVQLARESDEVHGVLRLVHERERALRQSAAALGGHVGEAALFFADAECEGGLLLLPLAPLHLGARTLQPFVLHRLAAQQPLSEAVPLRDAPDASVPDLPDDISARPDGADALEPPGEHDPKTPPEGS